MTKRNDHEIAASLISHYGLVQHPEGGWYAETYRSRDIIPHGAIGERFNGHRICSTAIYFLLQAGERSRLHRIKSDEVWHFYSGESLVIEEISESGEISSTVLGNDWKAGQKFQHVVKTGSWFGAWPQGAYTLVGCTVAPGFDFQDFELASGEILLRQFPHAAEIIKRLS